MFKKCDNTSVGMIVWKDGKILLIERNKPPFGFSPPSGHVDSRKDFKAAAIAELKEEAGLNAIDLKLVIEGRKENHCRREGGNWHYWKIYIITAEGEPQGDKDEVKNVGWYDKNDLIFLSRITEKYLKGGMKEKEWELSPGIEVVWYRWFKELKII